MADSDTDHRVLDAEVRERLAGISKWAEIKEYYKYNISNRFTALENLDDDDDVGF
jgi:hypothetical protein